MGGVFLGTGWKFAARQDDAKAGIVMREGEISLSREEEDIGESIRIIICTAPGERLMHPDFGCGIHDYVFAPNNVRTAGLIRYHVEQALDRWEPRIELDQVEVLPAPDDPAVILITIAYRVKSTDSRFNLVYPFYLERGEER